MKSIPHAWPVLTVLLSVVVAVTGPVGCVSQETLRAREEAAFRAGQLEALEQQKNPAVTVLGNVTRSRIEWTEGLTLVRALIQAEWRGRKDPSAIVLRRPETTINIVPEDLFRAQDEGPVLQPGDVIELRP